MKIDNKFLEYLCRTKGTRLGVSWPNCALIRTHRHLRNMEETRSFLTRTIYICLDELNRLYTTTSHSISEPTSSVVDLPLAIDTSTDNDSSAFKATQIDNLFPQYLRHLVWLLCQMQQ